MYIINALFLLIALAAPQTAPASIAANPRLVRRITLQDVKGQIGHMTVDTKGKRLFVAAPGNNTVEVIDLSAGKRIKTIKTISEPRDVFYVADPRELLVASGVNGTCTIVNADSFAVEKVIAVGKDAQTMRYDPRLRRVYVGGYDQNTIAVIDPVSRARVDDIVLERYPASFEPELGTSRMFVNVPRVEQIVVIDRSHNSVMARWPHQSENTRMALDQLNHRLFVVWQKPISLHVFDTETGEETDDLPCSPFVEDIFCDPESRQVYTSSSEGWIEVFASGQDGKYNRTARVKTSPGAGTSIFVPEFRSLYVGVPRYERQKAEILVYRVGS